MKVPLLFALVGLAIGFTVFTQQQEAAAPPESEQAKQILALVERAASWIDIKGKSISPEFRKPNSEWPKCFVDDLKKRSKPLDSTSR